MNLYDVAIVGGGPAGAFLATALARSGRSVLLLEASAVDKRKICGEYLCPKAVELLQETGLAHTLVGRPVHGMRLFSPKGITVESKFPGGSSGLAVRRDQLDPALLACAAEAGAEVRRGVRLEGFSYTGGIWNLQCGGLTSHARMLVGADGRHSFVARTLGVQKPHRSDQKKRVALHFFAVLEQESAELGEMHILKDGSYAGISATGKHELNVSIVCDAEKARPGGREAVTRLLAQSPLLSKRFLPLLEGTDVSVAFPVSHHVRSLAGPSWALVGDAAGFLDPLTGEGMFQAMKSARLLEQRLTEAFNGEGLTQSLSRYARDHRATFGTKASMNRFFQALIRHPSACDWVGKRLRARPSRADAFIGIVGNVYTPAQGFKHILFSSAPPKAVN